MTPNNKWLPNEGDDLHVTAIPQPFQIMINIVFTAYLMSVAIPKRGLKFYPLGSPFVYPVPVKAGIACRYCTLGGSNSLPYSAVNLVRIISTSSLESVSSTSSILSTSVEKEKT